ncbi:uncharacterized protein DS421_1g30700 [Arachis hypogaea]|nr:uncharacterized protein DS421_1g30700 [Arachis hypogaea]
MRRDEKQESNTITFTVAVCVRCSPSLRRSSRSLFTGAVMSIAEAGIERAKYAVDGFLSTVGRLQAEQHKQIFNIGPFVCNYAEADKACSVFTKLVFLHDQGLKLKAIVVLGTSHRIPSEY